MSILMSEDGIISLISSSNDDVNSIRNRRHLTWDRLCATGVISVFWVYRLLCAYIMLIHLIILWFRFFFPDVSCPPHNRDPSSYVTIHCRCCVVQRLHLVSTSQLLLPNGNFVVPDLPLHEYVVLVCACCHDYPARRFNRHNRCSCTPAARWPVSPYVRHFLLNRQDCPIQPVVNHLVTVLLLLPWWHRTVP